MKRTKFNISKFCGYCKKPLKTHSEYAFGIECPNEFVSFEGEENDDNEFKTWQESRRLLNE